MKRCVVASGNAGKLRELASLLEPFALQAVAQGELGIDAPEEPHPTFVENALLKARHASRLSGLPAVADDSGICVPALGGRPGVYSARFAARAGLPGGDAANNNYLVEELKALNGVGDNSTAWSAFYVCVIVWLEHATDPLPIIALETWQGRIVAEPAGEEGFGYDPHFWLPELQQTAAQLTRDEKNRLSHRGRAMRSLQAQLAARVSVADG